MHFLSKSGIFQWVINMIMIINNIYKKYPSSQFALENLSFSIGSSEAIGIIGKNGSGKSTLLKMLNGLVPYDQGEIFYRDKALSAMSDAEKRAMRKKVAYIFQHANLLEGESVLYHLTLVDKLRKQKVDYASIDAMLSFLQIAHLKHLPCRDLSGGQKQKVAIAMALLQKPEILLCDEISASLDAKSEKEIYDLLVHLKKTTDISLVIISHNLSVLKNVCDRVLLLSRGTFLESIEPQRSKEPDMDKKYFEHVREYLLQ